MSKELIEQARNCNHAHEMMRGCQATPREELERQIMSSLVPKNEREHWAAREIESLREQVTMLSAWIKQQGEITDTCTFNILREVCENCACHRNKALAATKPRSTK